MELGYALSSNQIEEYDKAGYTHVYFHQIGPEQDAFLAFARDELLAKI